MIDAGFPFDPAFVVVLIHDGALKLVQLQQPGNNALVLALPDVILGLLRGSTCFLGDHKGNGSHRWSADTCDGRRVL